MKGRAVLAALAALWLAVVAWSPQARAQATEPTLTRQVLVLVRLPATHFRPGGGYGGGYNDDLGRAAQRRLAVRIAKAHGLTLVDDWPMPLLGLDCFIMV